MQGISPFAGRQKVINCRVSVEYRGVRKRFRTVKVALIDSSPSKGLPFTLRLSARIGVDRERACVQELRYFHVFHGVKRKGGKKQCRN